MNFLEQQLTNLKQQVASIEAMSKQVNALQAPQTNSQHEQLIALYNEFIKTENGEFLVIGLQHFGEFVEEQQKQ